MVQKTTWQQLQMFSAVAGAYLARCPGDSKLKYAITRVSNQIRTLQERYKEQLADIEIDLCVVDEKGIITRDAAGNLQFTREGLKERNKQHRALLDQEVEIDAHLVPAPDELTPFELEAFTGLVIKDPAEANQENGAGNGGRPTGEYFVTRALEEKAAKQ